MAYYAKISVANGGLAAIKRHEGTDLYKNNVDNFERRPQRTLQANADGEVVMSANQPSILKQDQVLTAEVLQVLKMIEKNHSFKSADGDNLLFQKMFTDSEIAKSYQ